MIDLKSVDLGSVILLTLYIVVKDIVVPLVRKVTTKKETPDETIRRLNPNSLTLGKLGGILKSHVEYDAERTSEIKKDIREIRRDLVKHGERLAGLESPGR